MTILKTYSTKDTNIAPIITILLLQGPFLNIEDLMPRKFRSSRVIIQPVFQLVILLVSPSALVWPINRWICSLFNRYRRERIVRIALLE
jgi:hypothetical protein